MDEKILLAGSAALATAAFGGGKELVVKLLGPTADYLGDGMKGLVQKGTKNLERIFIAAAAKAGDKLNEPGAVPPRVLQRVLQEGPFIEDELAAEYYGGILAASRSKNLTDDSGAYWLGVIQRLSLYQIRMHHICYAAAKASYNENRWPRHADHIQMARVAIDRKSLQNSFNQEISPTIFEHIRSGLAREDLTSGIQVDEEFYFFDPSPAGTELALWASGYRDKQVEQFFRHEVSFPFFDGLPEIRFQDAAMHKHMGRGLKSSGDFRE